MIKIGVLLVVLVSFGGLVGVIGYDAGHGVGYDAGYDVGYGEGYDKGMQFIAFGILSEVGDYQEFEQYRNASTEIILARWEERMEEFEEQWDAEVMVAYDEGYDDGRTDGLKELRDLAELK